MMHVLDHLDLQALGLLTDPVSAPADVPLVLLPVRLETRFAADGGSLTVRIYPDDIHVPPMPGQTATARGLPDRFVVVAVQGDANTTAVGELIPAELVVGFPPDNNPAGLVRYAGLTLGAGMEWLVDLSQATQVGMAVTVQLPRPGAPVDYLWVFGLRSSMDADVGAGLLQDLMSAHAAGGGAAFLAPGTPTNNTETDRSDWQRMPPPATPPAVPGGVRAEDSNAARTARALGIDVAALAGLPLADQRDQGRARAANTALWPATWATFLDQLIIITAGGAPFDDAQKDETRTLFQQFVRGRGPLPAIRLNNQPYGILPVATFDGGWHADPTSRIEPRLTDLLRRARPFWRAGLTNVPQLGQGPLDESLLEILGSSPVMLGLQVRTVASKTTSSLAVPLGNVQLDNDRAQEQLDLMIWQALGFEPGRIGLKGGLARTVRPFNLPLVHASDGDFLRAVIQPDGRQRSVQSVLQALVELAEDREQRAVHAAAPPELTGALVQLAAPAAGNLQGAIDALASSTLRGDAQLDELHRVASQVESVVGPSGPILLAEHQPIASVRSSLAEVALNPLLAQTPATSAAAATLALGALGAWFRANAHYQELQLALAEIAGIDDIETRRILVAETLDIASHRLDAWTTALVARRLEQMRTARPRGVVLGAYGWLENLTPGAQTTRDGGYIHAPGPAHAATAGILRSGYLAHNPDAGGSGALAVDLTSKRVRVAVDLLDGLRQGQPLGALLGYRIERGLHAAGTGLDRFFLSLRSLAPLVAGRLVDRGAALVDQQSREAVAANNVVDGVQLLQLDRNAIFDKLQQVPANNTYLEPGTWQGPSPADRVTINQVLDDAAAAQDALADLLLAEAVHQLVQGNSERAGAALNAAGDGSAPPPEPEVVRTPARGVAITHRLLLLLPDEPLPAGGWNASAPRALAEPRLEAWAAAQLGPASSIVVQVAADGGTITLDAASLSALDVVLDSAEPRVLERRLRQTIPALADAPLTSERNAEWPVASRAWLEVITHAAALRRLLAGARPALGEAFARPSDPPARTVTDADLADLNARVLAARSTLATAADALGAALDQVDAGQVPDSATVAAALQVLDSFGISAPQVASSGSESALLVARAAHGEAVRRIALADKTLGATTVQAAIDGGQALFGDAFWMLPRITPGGTPDGFATAYGTLGPSAARIRRFLRDTASVRPSVARYAETRLFGDALNQARPLVIAQLTSSNQPAIARWIGLPFDPDHPSPEGPVVSIVMDAPSGVDGATPIAGLVLDEWTEIAPRRIERTLADGTTLRQAVVTTGVAVNANAPNARPPQAILLAVSADGQRWTTPTLADTLAETLELAKLRAVTLERVLWAGRILPALQEQSRSLQGEKVLDIHKLTTGAREVLLPFVREQA